MKGQNSYLIFFNTYEEDTSKTYLYLNSNKMAVVIKCLLWVIVSKIQVIQFYS